MVRSIKGSLLDEVDVLTYSEYMQTSLSSGYLQDTTNIQADPEVDAEVAMVRESIVLNTMIYHIYSTYLWKAARTDDDNSVVTEAEILLSLSYVAEDGTNMQADLEASGEAKLVRESIVLNTMI